MEPTTAPPAKPMVLAQLIGGILALGYALYILLNDKDVEDMILLFVIGFGLVWDAVASLRGRPARGKGWLVGAMAIIVVLLMQRHGCAPFSKYLTKEVQAVDSKNDPT